MQIRVIGAGVQLVKHLTLDALSHLTQVKKVLFFPSIAGETERLLTKLGVTLYEDLSILYHDGDEDVNNYERIVMRVAFEARRLGDVALLLPGHPRLGVTTLTWFETKPQFSDFEILVVAGISCFDTLINDLKRDPLTQGSVIIDANWMLLYSYVPNPKLDHYIFHVGSIGTHRTYRQTPATDNHLDFLKAALLRSFSINHPFVLIESPVGPDLQSTYCEGVIGSLEKIIDFIHFGTTLFIPGIPPGPAIANQIFGKLLSEF